MISRHIHNGTVWIDLLSPTAKEVADISMEFELDHAAAEDLLLPSLKPRVEFSEKYIYLILHFPTLRHGRKTRDRKSVV